MSEINVANSAWFIHKQHECHFLLLSACENGVQYIHTKWVPVSAALQSTPHHKVHADTLYNSMQVNYITQVELPEATRY